MNKMFGVDSDFRGARRHAGTIFGSKIRTNLGCGVSNVEVSRIEKKAWVFFAIAFAFMSGVESHGTTDA